MAYKCTNWTRADGRGGDECVYVWLGGEGLKVSGVNPLLVINFDVLPQIYLHSTSCAIGEEDGLNESPQ